MKRKMKKFILVIMTILMGSGLYADGIKLMGGLNLLKYSFSSSENNVDWGYKLGFCVGAGIEFDLTYSGTVAIEVDGLLIQRNGSKIEDPDSPDLNPNYNLSFLCIPVLVRLRFKSESPLYLLGGGELSVIMSHKFGTKEEELADLKEDTPTFDYGLVVGCGFKIGINDFQDFFIEGRYHFGFVNLWKNIDKNTSLKNNVILVILGIKTY